MNLIQKIFEEMTSDELGDDAEASHGRLKNPRRVAVPG